MRPSTVDAPGRVASSRAVVAAVACGGFCASLTQTVVVPLVPALPRLLHASGVAVSWLVTATLLASAISTPLLTRLGDQFGRRRLILVSLGLFAAGSAVCALTSNLPALIAGRALQGCAIAVIPLGISIIGTALPSHRRPGGIALVSATLGFGSAIGLPLSGVVAQYSDFHLLFWGSLVAAIGAGIWVRLAVPESVVRAGGRVDYTGAVLLALTLSALLLPLSNGATWGWRSPATLGLLGAFALLTLGFIRHQVGRTGALIDIATARRRPVLLTNVASVLVGFGLFSNFLGTAPFVEAPILTGYGFGVSTLAGGLFLLPGGLTMMVISPVAGRFIARYGPRTSLIFGSLVVAVGYVMRLTVSHTELEVLLGSIVASAGGALAYSAMPALILGATPESEAAAATGLNALARTIGTALASAAATALLGAMTVTIGGAVFASDAAFQLLFAFGGVSALAAAMLTAFVPIPEARPATA
jgi:MFS family permease